jgi:hypothetical protein
MMREAIKVSVPESYWSDAIQNRAMHLDESLPAHAKIGNELLARGFIVKDDPANWETNLPTRKGRLVIELTLSDIEELIQECSYYSQGYYDADMEKPFKYFGNKLKEKLAALKSYELVG